MPGVESSMNEEKKGYEEKQQAIQRGLVKGRKLMKLPSERAPGGSQPR